MYYPVVVCVVKEVYEKVHINNLTNKNKTIQNPNTAETIPKIVFG